MNVRVALLPQLAGNTSNAVCIVVDVLRATTVTSVLFDRNCPLIYVAASHNDARKFATDKTVVLCGETGGIKEPDFDYGNSPVEFSTIDFTGRPVVLSTTNGTKAVAHVSHARKVFLGAAINRMAVAIAACEEANAAVSDIVIVCSGTDANFTLEDATVAGLYVEAIYGMAGGMSFGVPRLDDAAIACRRLWQHEPNMLRGWMEGIHAQTLGDRGFGDDVGYCVGIDKLLNVPTLVTQDMVNTVTCPIVLVGI